MAIATALCLIFASAATSQALAGTTHRPHLKPVDQLYVQAARQGTLRRAKSGHLRLVLRHVDPTTHSLYCCVDRHHRQLRRESAIPTSGFVRSWAGFGFAKRPPSAVLHLLRAKPSADAIALRLRRPRLHGHRLVYRVRARETVGPNLSSFRPRLDRRLPSHFGAASLHIDQQRAPVAGGCSSRVPCESPNGCFIMPFAQCAGADLSGFNFTGADLRGTDFSDANLTGAIFRFARLVGADLRGADLTDADLTYADLREAKYCHTTMPNGSINDDDC